MLQRIACFGIWLAAARGSGVPPMINSHVDGGGVCACGSFGRRIFAAVALIFTRTIHFTFFALASWLAFAALSGPDAVRAQDNPRRVLMLYPYNNLFPVSVITGEAARKRMNEQSRQPLEFYSDFLDLGRFSGDEHETR